MRTMELFCGTKSFSKVMEIRNHNTFTIDNNPKFSPDVCIDLTKYYSYSEQYMPDFIWASPPCQTFSVASIGTHWKGGKGAYIPKTKEAEKGLKLLECTIKIIAEKRPMFWCIENPRGVMRKVINRYFNKYGIKDFHRTTITYCQYGDKRMKPTDIWTNIPNWYGKRCKNGSRCHEPAPRGSKTGTQGLKNAEERGAIPPALFEELLEHINKLRRKQ